MSTAQTTKHTAAAIEFRAALYTIGDWTVLRLPASASAKLPTRGQAMVEGTINGRRFHTPLEPDGRGSHWFRLKPDLLRAVNAHAGDVVTLAIVPMATWPEPDVPADWQKALAGSKVAHDLWQRVTPMARWEWIRWARATNNAETRKRRVEVGISKLEAGERRPCCWNRNLSTEPLVSKNGVLLDPGSA